MRILGYLYSGCFVFPAMLWIPSDSVSEQHSSQISRRLDIRVIWRASVQTTSSSSYPRFIDSIWDALKLLLLAVNSIGWFTVLSCVAAWFVEFFAQNKTFSYVQCFLFTGILIFSKYSRHLWSSRLRPSAFAFNTGSTRLSFCTTIYWKTRKQIL